MTGFAEGATTWVAAVATLVVLSRLLGARRLFDVAQMLLAGLATGYLVVLAVNEVLVPRLAEPLAADAGRIDLWIGLLLVAATAGARWLPVSFARVPVVFVVAALAAFALGGAVVGTLLPQVAAGIVGPGSASTVAGGLLALAISVAVAISFLHGGARGKPLAVTAAAGRWLLLAGIGGWLGYLLVTRLALLVERISFLLFEWLGLGR